MIHYDPDTKAQIKTQAVTKGFSFLTLSPVIYFYTYVFTCECAHMYTCLEQQGMRVCLPSDSINFFGVLLCLIWALKRSWALVKNIIPPVVFSWYIPKGFRDMTTDNCISMVHIAGSGSSLDEHHQIKMYGMAIQWNFMLQSKMKLWHFHKNRGNGILLHLMK